MEHKTNVWDVITAMIGGAITTTLFGNGKIVWLLDLNFWQYSTDALLFALKAASGGLIAIFFKKMGEDFYQWIKKKVFNK